MKEIYLVRHGKQNTIYFNENRELSEIGVKQARLLRDRLKDEHYDKFYSSTLKRAVETADILNENWHMPIERREELNEIDYGIYTGEEIASLKGKNKAFFDALNSRKTDLSFPEGENGEMVYSRVKPIFTEIEKSSFSRILIVCHGAMIRATICGLLRLPFTARLAFSKYLDNTSMTKLLYDEETGLYYLESINDRSHLLAHQELLRDY